MGHSLQVLNANQRMAEWSERISSCRYSGISVKRWCQEQGIAEKTYYYWQRHVFKALTAQQEPYFARAPELKTLGFVAQMWYSLVRRELAKPTWQ